MELNAKKRAIESRLAAYVRSVSGELTARTTSNGVSVDEELRKDFELF